MKSINHLAILLFLLSIFALKTYAMPNPWINCGDDIYCASQKAGFNLPLDVKNYSARAMKDMIEITFPLNKRKTVTVRKSELYDGPADKNGIKNISGDYNNYPVNKSVTLENGVVFNTRGYKNKYHVVNFASETGYYGFSSKEGMNLGDIKKLYNLLKDAQAPRCSFDESKTIEELEDLRRTDDIVEPVFTQDCFPRTLQKKGITKECFERANLGDDTFCSTSEIRMIKRYYKKGQDKDPLNNGDNNFCARQDSICY